MTLRIVAARSDGLCMRLLALLNAMDLASDLSADMAVVWPVADHPAVDLQTYTEPERLFSQGWLAAHRLSADQIPRDAPVLSDPADLDRALAKARSVGTLLVEVPGPIRQDRARDRAQSALLFDRIDWTPTVRAALAAARSLPIAPGAVALHIRGGDILHGTHSNTGAYAHKAVSVFEAEALVGRLVAAGRPVWLVGQEPDLQHHLASRFPTVRILSRTAEARDLDAVQSVLFDVIALSRMAEVFGGNSAVARLAVRLGGGRWVDTMRLDLGLNREAFTADPLASADYAGLSDALKSHSYYKLFYLSDPPDWTLTDLALARLMLRWRPHSQYAKLVLCLLCAHFGLWPEAERLAAEVIGPGSHEGWPDAVTGYVMAADDPFPADHLAVLSDADPERCPACAFLAACGAAEQPERGHHLLATLLARGLAVSGTIRDALAERQAGRA